MNSRLIRMWAVAGLLALALGNWRPVAAQEVSRDTQHVLADELRATVENIVTWITNRNDDGSLFIESFRILPPNLNSTNGNVVKFAVADAIGQKLTLKRQSKYSLTGKATLKLTSSGSGSAVIDFTVDGPNASQTFSEPVKNSRVIDVLFGNTITHSPPTREVDRIPDAVGTAAGRRDGHPNPPQTDSGTKIRLTNPTTKADFAVEIGVRDKGATQYVPQQIEFGDGSNLGTATPFVEIRRGQEYEIRLYNYDPLYDVFAEVLVDGVNVNHFYNDDQAKAFKPTERISHWLVHRASGGVPGTQFIAGWQRDKREANRFEVKSFPESVVSELQRKEHPEISLQDSDAIGTITVIYRQAWIKGETPPGQGGDATGRGEVFENKVDVIGRETGKVCGQVCIRYASP